MQEVRPCGSNTTSPRCWCAGLKEASFKAIVLTADTPVSSPKALSPVNSSISRAGAVVQGVEEGVVAPLAQTRIGEVPSLSPLRMQELRYHRGCVQLEFVVPGDVSLSSLLQR